LNTSLRTSCVDALFGWQGLKKEDLLEDVLSVTLGLLALFEALWLYILLPAGMAE
jgi:hypothetical protein